MQVSGFTFRVAGERADNLELYEALYRLRYQVYVNEWGFEKSEDHPDGMEKDIHDAHARHFYACVGTEKDVIGTARLILPSHLPLPIQENFSFYENFKMIPNQSVAEISRLAISKDFRRRAIDSVIFNTDKPHTEDLKRHQEGLTSIATERRKCEHELVRGIYLAVYRECIMLGITHCYAVMARGLCVILARWGICFEQIGPEKSYHGIRAPYVLSIEALEKKLAKNNPELLKLAREGVE